MLSLVAILAALLNIVSVSSDCPAGWSEYFGTELCIRGFEREMAFMDAMAYCMELGNGSSLVSIHNAFQNMAVATIADEVSQSCNFWIGLYNFDGSTAYSWADGSTLDYQNWATGYPMSDIEDSMVYVDLAGRNKWVSTDNLIKARCFVCQLNSGQSAQTVTPSTFLTTTTTAKISTTTTTTAKNSTTATTTDPFAYDSGGWDYYDGHCYYLRHTLMDETEAESLCAWKNSTLVSITSAAEEGFVESMVSKRYCTYVTRIGLVNSGGWQWMDGSPLNYTNWGVGWPRGDNPHAVLYERIWANIESTYRGCALCKQKAAPDGCWDYYNGNRYYLNATLMNAAEAESLCAQMDSNMISIMSFEEQAYVYSIAVSNYNECYSIGILLGLVNSGGWHWMDGNPLNYTNWYYGYPQPNNNTHAIIWKGPWINTDSSSRHCVLCKQKVKGRKTT